MRNCDAPRQNGGANAVGAVRVHDRSELQTLCLAAIAADVTIGFMPQPDRAARMVAQYAVDQALPGLGEVIDKLINATFDATTSGTYEAEVRRATERVLVDRVMWLASAKQNAQVRAIASYKLQQLAARLRAEVGRTDSDVAAHTLLAADIKRFLERPRTPRPWRRWRQHACYTVLHEDVDNHDSPGRRTRT